MSAIPVEARYSLGFAGDVAGIAVVTLFGDRIDHIADQHQRGHFRKGIEQVEVRIRLEQHVALMDSGPAANGRTIDAKTVFK